ncbi:MAG: alpha/beta hydrolase [Salinivirgaceae bacterium]|nr:alpha/beta hydrolase [Salinivirgaceae bacterium]
MTFFEFRGKKIAYTYRGQGFTIVLLHGYLETKEVWSSFGDKLAENYRVISIDIPGHGASEQIQDTHSMGLMAEAVDALLANLQIEKCLMIGHSMGGYIALAYANLFAHRLLGLTLFHSSIFADSEEKKANRYRELDFIRKGKINLLINANLPKTFATQNLLRFEQKIEMMKYLAQNHSKDGICSLLQGMIERPDRQELMYFFKKPILFIFGRNDQLIPQEVAEEMLEINPFVKSEWLENSGHMGFIEEQEKSLIIISNFAKAIQIQIS